MMRPRRPFIRRRPRLEPRRPRRLKGLPLNMLLPNMLTTLALSAGLTAIRFGIQERYEHAVLAIVIAAIFDALDGRIARLLNGASRFGEELDSLSDVISFGVAPGMLLYMWVMKDGGGLGWIAVLAFSVCCALRLARFNSALGNPDLPPWAFKYFTGVPAPMGGALVLLPMMLSFETGPGVLDHPLLVGPWAVGVGALMISRWPTFSLKGIRVPPHYVVPVLVGVGLTAALLVVAPWVTLAILGLLYLGSLPFSLLQFRRLSRETARLKAEAQEAGEGQVEPAGTAAGEGVSPS
ncbi:MAG TPA: CDP-diacylglycerol--serine O-phosphatidyltransferase [Azospirillaceae bacterium]|nr:CDP-diacylglycerol--serine O-phosphatidyltransferase [Azospirillaceae bacterium]